jgi:hypothetical protein
MTEQVREAQLLFRDALRRLCLMHYESAEKKGLSASSAAGIVAEECLHMCAYFVTRGSMWSEDGFVEEARKIYDWHKNVATKEKEKPN